MAENNEKRKALDVALSQIEKQFGKGSVMRLGEFKAMEVEAIPTGALSLDIALGIGGLPRGRIIEIYGPESSGKTTLALSAIAEAQKLGGEAAFIDAEHALDPVHAKKLGVDIKKCVVFEDTKSGVKSAYTAGAKVIGMRAGRKAEDIWKFEKVVDVIDDFTEVSIEKLNKLFN